MFLFTVFSHETEVHLSINVIRVTATWNKLIYYIILLKYKVRTLSDISGIKKIY